MATIIRQSYIDKIERYLGKGEDARIARLYAEPYLSGRSSYQKIWIAGRSAGNGGGAGGGKARGIGRDFTDFLSGFLTQVSHVV